MSIVDKRQVFFDVMNVKTDNAGLNNNNNCDNATTRPNITTTDYAIFIAT
jgi:hypothetical protein